ncbi:hypothetical protein C5167_018556 [Papaver somniferum]|uniref:SUI1 domain-containing protein n=1 Tax=Papaver somniferum TaxID=3469 RepID=A0A4Y7IMK3_PAPSO|nr:hypothetical protein C5167_018556 [Papaver somniferum]
MLDELNLRLSFGDDPFGEKDNFSGKRAAKSKGTYVHLRIHKRKGKRCLTTVEGLNPELNLENILKEFKKSFCCNGNVAQDKELGKVIQLQGDQRKNVLDSLVRAGVSDKEDIKIHGY